MAVVAALPKLDLGEFREAAVTGLLQVMEDGGYGRDADWLHAEAARALGELGSSRAVPVLVEAVGEKYYDDLVRAAARALGHIGDSEAVPGLISVLEKRLDRNSGELVEALGRLGDPRAANVLIGILDRYRDYDSSGASSLVNRTVTALGRLGAVRAIPHLIAQLYDTTTRRDVASVTGALKRLGGTVAVEVMVEELELVGSNYRERIRAADVLGALEDPAAVPPLIGALEDEEPNLRVSAARALGLLRDQRAFEPLVNLLDDESAPVRRSAVTSLGRLGDTGDALVAGAPEELSAVTALIRALEDEEPTVRVSAVRALGGLCDLRAYEPIVNLLDDEDADVRASGVSALGGLGDARALPYLSAAIDEDEDRRVRRAAERSLEELRDSQTQEAS